MTTQSPIPNPQSPDLYALIISLTAHNAGILRATQGRLAHAAFLNILHHADPALSETIHDLKGRKPFTISPLEGFGRAKNGQLKIHAGQEGWLRVTLLDSQLFQSFIQYFLQPTNKPTIKLHQQNFHISQILTTPASHKLAGHTSLDHLTEHWQIPIPHLSSLILLHFRTPTAFRLYNSPHRIMHVLPDPGLVFGQLATYWDALTGSDTADAVREYCHLHVVVARHDIRTHMYDYGKNRKQIGFAGKVTFKILDKDNQRMLRHLHRLADLAFYTGLGSKTTMGMGQVVRMRGEL